MFIKFVIDKFLMETNVEIKAWIANLNKDIEKILKEIAKDINSKKDQEYVAVPKGDVLQLIKNIGGKNEPYATLIFEAHNVSCDKMKYKGFKWEIYTHGGTANKNKVWTNELIYFYTPVSKNEVYNKKELNQAKNLILGQILGLLKNYL
jgi:hypothetical protein